MRYALISDIHANLHALDAVLAAIDAGEAVDAIYHIGDLVGHGALPNETVERVRHRDIEGVSGNYDSTIATGHKQPGCQPEGVKQEGLGKVSFEFTCRASSSDSKRFLAALPFSLDIRPLGGHRAGPRLVLVHGTPVRNTQYWDAGRSDEFCAAMAGLVGLESGDVIAFGHTHRPWHRMVGGVHFVNTGSVGRPKDGDPRAGYVIVELGDNDATVALQRTSYDVEAAAAALEAAGLPDEFADFLRRGGNKEELAWNKGDRSG